MPRLTEIQSSRCRFQRTELSPRHALAQIMGFTSLSIFDKPVFLPKLTGVVGPSYAPVGKEDLRMRGLANLAQCSYPLPYQEPARLAPGTLTQPWRAP